MHLYSSCSLWHCSVPWPTASHLPSLSWQRSLALVGGSLVQDQWEFYAGMGVARTWPARNTPKYWECLLPPCEKLFFLMLWEASSYFPYLLDFTGTNSPFLGPPSCRERESTLNCLRGSVSALCRWLDWRRWHHSTWGRHSWSNSFWKIPS